MESEFDIDFSKIGFRCGLEIHQQIGYYKLFCKCPTVNIEAPLDYQIKRRLRGVVGETGEIDIAAKFETEKGKYFIYEGHSANTCLVELDETPPYSLSEEALEIALKVALLLNAKIVDEIQIMRKTVVDGSNVSGFQRTALIAMDGSIDSPEGKISIPTICIEEEAAQKLEEGKDFVRYKLDRLGIPLIEIATGTEIKNPEHAKEIASHLGMILRSVEGVKRGLGTIRQDVNISIKEGARTEIKGFQDLRSIPKVVEFEVRRQLESVKQGKKLSKEVRKAEPDFTTSFLRPLPGAARLYPETDILPIRIEKYYLDKLNKQLPRLIAHKIEDFEKKYKLPHQLAKELIDNENFESFVNKFKKIDPSTIAHILLNTPKEIKTRFNLDPSKLNGEDFEEVLDYLNEGKIAKEAIIDLLVKKLRSEKIDLSHFESVSDSELENEIKKLIQEKPGLNIGGYMGLVMSKYRGKVEGKKIMEMLKKYIK